MGMIRSMPQEFQVLRCFKCETFQVSQVKKSPKWECKICQEKQSTKHIYGRGSGADCRKMVQELNMKRMEVADSKEEELYAQEDQSEEDWNKDVHALSHQDLNIHPQPSSAGLKTTSRWDAFLPSSKNKKNMECGTSKACAIIEAVDQSVPINSELENYESVIVQNDSPPNKRSRFFEIRNSSKPEIEHPCPSKVTKSVPGTGQRTRTGVSSNKWSKYL